jgi:hypothetical protein
VSLTHHTHFPLWQLVSLQCGHGGNFRGCGADATCASVAWADGELKDAAALVFAIGWGGSCVVVARFLLLECSWRGRRAGSLVGWPRELLIELWEVTCELRHKLSALHWSRCKTSFGFAAWRFNPWREANVDCHPF